MSEELVPPLRPLEAFPIPHEGEEMICLRDPEGFAPGVALVPQAAILVLAFFDGQHSIRDIQQEILRRGGPLVPSQQILHLLQKLDEAYLLDSPRFRDHRQKRISEYLQSPTRPATHAGGAYEADPVKLRSQLERLFTGEQGPGLPDWDGQPMASGPRSEADAPSDSQEVLRGILSPHIDLHRGGPAFAWAYKHLVENTQAEVFVIFGTAHNPTKRRFTLTRKDFATPLGPVPTDQKFIDALEGSFGPGLLDDEFAHAHEHSIEFQVVFLQYLLGPRRPFLVVPILVGSFHDLIVERREPTEDAEVARFIEAVSRAEQTGKRRVCYISGGDLAHVGPRFGDPQPLRDTWLQSVREADLDLLRQAERGDLRRFFAHMVRDQDRRRICGFPPTYTLMAVTRPQRGQLLKYDQAVDESRHSCVSFASVAFYGQQP